MLNYLEINIIRTHLPVLIEDPSLLGKKEIDFFLTSYSKYRLRKLNLESMKLLHSMMSIMAEDGSTAIQLTDTDEIIKGTPKGMILHFFYEKGLSQNLKAQRLLNFVKDNAIYFFERLKVIKSNGYKLAEA